MRFGNESRNTVFKLIIWKSSHSSFRSLTILAWLLVLASNLITTLLCALRDWLFEFFFFDIKELQQGAQKCDRFWLIHILSYRFNPIRSQLETVLNLRLVNICMKECELIKGGHTFGPSCNYPRTAFLFKTIIVTLYRNLDYRKWSNTPRGVYSIFEVQEVAFNGKEAFKRERGVFSLL